MVLLAAPKGALTCCATARRSIATPCSIHIKPGLGGLMMFSVRISSPRERASGPIRSSIRSSVLRLNHDQVRLRAGARANAWWARGQGARQGARQAGPGAPGWLLLDRLACLRRASTALNYRKGSMSQILPAAYIQLAPSNAATSRLQGPNNYARYRPQDIIRHDQTGTGVSWSPARP
jgi:hypothetical protein